MFFLQLLGHRRQLPEQRCQGKLLDSSVCVHVFFYVFVKSGMIILMVAYSRMSQQDGFNTRISIDPQGWNLFLLTH